MGFTVVNSREVERLKRVYDHYRAAGICRARWSADNPGNQAILREREVLLRQLLAAHDFWPLGHRRILDIGCGGGKMLATFNGWGVPAANLFGVDLLGDRIADAEESFPKFNFQIGNAEALDFEDGAFDLVLLFTVFSSILDEGMARNVAGEVSRVLKPGGAVAWYDFIYNNRNNPHVRGMRWVDIKDLFPRFLLALQKTTLFPPLGRRLGRLTTLLYPALAAVPWLRTHYLGLLIKAGSP